MVLLTDVAHQTGSVAAALRGIVDSLPVVGLDVCSVSAVDEL